MSHDLNELMKGMKGQAIQARLQSQRKVMKRQRTFGSIVPTVYTHGFMACMKPKFHYRSGLVPAYGAKSILH